MKNLKKIRKYFNPIAEIILFIFALGIFCYSGYKIASHYGLLDNKASACSSCNVGCPQNPCPCCPTPTSPPEPTPTTMEPTPTTGEPTPTTAEPTPTSEPGEPTPTESQAATPTPTPTSGVGGTSDGGGGGGGGGGGPASPCTPPEAPKTPELLSAVIVSSTEVKLTWRKVDRATHYAIAYGESSHNYTYGNSNVGDTDSYTVGGLKPGATYFFAVSAAIGGDCPVASPYSNELSSRSGGSLILGAKTDPKPTNPPEGQLEGGVSTQAGEVAGAQAKDACPYWWIVLLGQTILLAGVYAFWLKKKELPRHWWLVVPGVVIIAYLIDRYAHTHWYIPSRMCRFEPFLGMALAGLETVGFKSLRRPRQKK